jgi:UDP-N-acetyl-D-mannosaminuronate dehydrogenase
VCYASRVMDERMAVIGLGYVGLAVVIDVKSVLDRSAIPAGVGY